jgi:hypothetical protein
MMNRRDFAKLSALTLAAKALPARAATQSGIMAPVLTRGYNNARTGCNSSEKILTQTNVASQGIRVLFSLPMEGDARGAESQTLIIPSVAMDDGTTRDIALVSAMNGLVYAFDANESDIEWVKKASEPVTGTKAIDGWMVNDHWSFLSTGVVDHDTNWWYGVAWTDPNGNAATARYYMHVYDVATGNRVVPPVLVAGTSNGQNFNSMMRKQRSSLLLATFNGVKTVFFACGTVSESSQGAAGWVFPFDVASNAFKTPLALTTGEGAGVWMAGGGLVADANYIYCTTGNGGFDGVKDWGEATLQMKYANGTVTVLRGWSPWSDRQREGLDPVVVAAKKTAKLAGINAPTSAENLPVNVAHMKMAVAGAMAATSPEAGWYDEDYGAGGLTLVDGYLITVGKDGICYVLNTSNFPSTALADLSNPAANYAKLASPPIWATNFPGYQYNPAPQDATTLDFLPGGKTRHNHSTPVSFWSSINGRTIFFWGENSPLRAFKFVNGKLIYLAQSNEVASVNSVNSPGGMPGGFMALSCNGTVQGTAILWATIPYGNANTGDGVGATAGRFLAYDAEHFTNGAIRVLWDSQAEGVAFPFNKFNPPVVDGGKIFLPTYKDYTLVLGLA